MDKTGKSITIGFKTKLGYGIGQMGDSLGFNVFYYFFLFFLTDIAAIPPAVAGTISLIAVIWDAVTDPIIGYLSDNLKGRHGKRRPFMIAAAVPYGICTFLLFNNVSFSSNVKSIYFILISMFFWTVYTIYVIPFFALGGEITENFEERTSIRVWASVFLYIAVFLASAAPPMIVSLTERAGGSTIAGWRNVGIIFGILVATVIVICVLFTKENLEMEQAEEVEKENIIKSYLSIFKLRPVKFLAGSVVLWALVCSMASSGPVFLMTNNLHYGAEKQSLYFTVFSLLSIVWIPVVDFLARRFDKKQVYCYAMLFSGIGMCLFAFIGFPSFAFLIAMALLYTFGDTTFWTLYYSMMYDINEVDEWINNKRRDGAITAALSFCQKMGAALALQVTGIVLQIGGYGIPGKERLAEKTILFLNTLIPGAIGIMAALCVIAYPLTKRKYEAILGALERRKKGETYSTAEFQDLL